MSAKLVTEEIQAKHFTPKGEYFSFLFFLSVVVIRESAGDPKWQRRHVIFCSRWITELPGRLPKVVQFGYHCSALIYRCFAFLLGTNINFHHHRQENCHRDYNCRSMVERRGLSPTVPLQEP